MSTIIEFPKFDKKFVFPLKHLFCYQTTFDRPYNLNRNKILETSIHIFSMHHKLFAEIIKENL